MYFGLAEDEAYYDDDESTSAQADMERTYKERPNVRRIDRQRRSRGSSSDFDEIFAPGDEPDVVRRTRSTAPADAPTGVMRRDAPAAPPQEEVATAVKVHLIAPRSFNDAQQIADRFKASVPVIINLQAAEPELSKRLIDFGSGLTYALDGGMQRIAEKVFLLTPHNVEVSAEDRAKLVEHGFFHPV